MVDGPDDTRMGGRKLVRDRPRRIARAVVDDHDLERLRDRRQRLERLVDEAAHVGLLVVGRKEVREVGQPIRHGRAAAARAETRKTL